MSACWQLDIAASVDAGCLMDPEDPIRGEYQSDTFVDCLAVPASIRIDALPCLACESPDDSFVFPWLKALSLVTAHLGDGKSNHEINLV